MERQIVKAEILWTRRCPLRCSFCNMPNDTPRASVKDMKVGLKRLKDLGCGFIAIYGASPLYDMEGLGEYIAEAEDLGILTTVITDGIVINHRQKLLSLYNLGLRSLTMSYDFIPYDAQSTRKSLKAMDLLRWFSGLEGIRDVEIVSVVTSANYKEILDQLPSLLVGNRKLWFSFDFLHLNRGNPGTKCKGEESDLLPSTKEVQEFCRGLLHHKLLGAHIHQSESLLKLLVAEPEVLVKYSWKCCSSAFPSWLTIDADGTVLPCDDFYTGRQFKVWDLTPIEFEKFCGYYKREVEKKCVGCFWTTHYDAVLIKTSGAGFDSYVHVN